MVILEARRAQCDSKCRAAMMTHENVEETFTENPHFTSQLITVIIIMSNLWTIGTGILFVLLSYNCCM